MVPEITLRSITSDDTEFLYYAYASTREEELAVPGWSEAQKEQFLRFQFRAQHDHYQKHFPNAKYDVILAGKTPIGRLYVDRRVDEIRIIDIALLTEHRGAGVGGKLVRQLLDESTATGRPVRIHVKRNNPAKRLYHRLGFREIGGTGVYDFMEWIPGAVQSNRNSLGSSVHRGVSTA
jgi:ribosomal protein S18 acetylase RimI-like enzyme